jgi:hypothetical protein
MARKPVLRSGGEDAAEMHGQNTKEKKRKKKEQLEEELKHTEAQVTAWKSTNILR